ncbi:MAG: MFS transporter, partial [Syntrophales bacterium]|nr:MFS transporter [Syntrophales bacterium]
DAKPTATPIIIPWGHLKKDILFRWFLLFIFLHGVVTASSFTYTGYFLDDVLKTPLEIGFILGTWALFEIPVMIFSRELLDRFGNRWLIVSGLFLSGIRLILFSCFALETPFVWKWAAALLHGPGYGLSQLGIIDFVDRRAHPEMRATYLNIATVARMSLASSIGGILGSMLIERWGGAFLMQFCGWVTIAMIFFFVFLIRRHGRQG